MKLEIYEALANASPSPTCPHGFSFRSGDKISLTEEQAAILLKAGAVRALEPKAPSAVVEQESPRRGGRKSNDD